MKLKSLVLMTLVLVLVSVPVLGQGQGQGMQGMMPEGQSDIEPDEVVATVNGEELLFEELEEITGIQNLTMQLMQSNPQFAQFLTESEAGEKFLNAYRRDSVDELIQQELLRQKADELDIEVTEEKEDEYFSQVKEQLDSQREQQDLSEEEYIEQLNQQIPDQEIESMDDIKELVLAEADLRTQVLIEEHIVDEIDEDLDEEEMQQAQLEQNEDFQAYVDELREEADVEVMEDLFE
ncbi:MAG: SurA N-terminal domain-containing protein [bacterium]